MTGGRFALRALTAVAALIGSALTMPHVAEAAAVDGVIMVRGNKMYNAKTSERFFIKGVRGARSVLIWSGLVGGC